MMEDEDSAYDQIAPNAEQENREAEDEGIREADKFVYFNPNTVGEQRHYDIGIELQSSCSVPPVETTGIMLPDDEYLTLLRNLNLRQKEFFNHVVHWIKCKDIHQSMLSCRRCMCWKICCHKSSLSKSV